MCSRSSTSSAEAAKIALVSVADGSVRILKSFDGGGPKRVRFSPDGRFVAYNIQSQQGSAKYNVFVLAVDGGRETGVVQHPANDVLFDWTPDGRKLLFGSDRSGTMGAWWVTMAGGQVEGVPEVVKPDLGQDARPIGFTRDGSYFYRGRTNLSDVFIAEVDFASGRLLAPPVLATQRFAGSNSWPAWSPDGRQLAYLSRRGPGAGWGSMAVWLKDMASGEVREVPSGLETVIRAGWFPDGRSLLAIAQLGGGAPGQFRINVQTGESEPVDLFKVAGPGAAAWSRDGRTMFFQRWRGQQTSAIVARDVSTGQALVFHSLADPSVYLTSPLVYPDGQHLAMVVNDAESRIESCVRRAPRGRRAAQRTAERPDGVAAVDCVGARQPGCALREAAEPGRPEDRVMARAGPGRVRAGETPISQHRACVSCASIPTPAASPSRAVVTGRRCG